jgi:hypothetical protein
MCNDVAAMKPNAVVPPKIKMQAGHLWLTPVILANQEARDQEDLGLKEHK